MSDKERKDYTKQAIASLEGITESFKDKLNPMKAQRLLDRLPKKNDNRLTRSDIKIARDLVGTFGSKKTINKMKSNIQDKNRVRTMSKGGGMDMGAKKPLSFKEQLEKARAEGTVEKSKTSKYLKKRSRGDKINALLKSANVSNMNKGGGMDMGQMPNTVKPEPRGNPGIVENVVGKGGDYIKDLID